MRRLSILAAAPILLVTWHAWAHFHEGPPTAPSFQLDPGARIGGAEPAPATAAYLAGSRIAALDDGALVIDADRGDLVRADLAGAPTARVPIGRDAGVLAYDPGARLVYVADRRGDRIVVARVLDHGLVAVTAWRTPVEPYGVALAPDRTTLLVTTVADRTLVAYDVATGSERWRATLAREPRGIAIAPDGSRAIVAHVGADLVEDVALGGGHEVTQRALASGDVRGSFAALFMGPREAVVPFQRSVPVNPDPVGGINTDHYGGAEFAPPVTHHLAFLGLGAGAARTSEMTAQIADQQVRAIAWDGGRDALYLAGMGTDSLLEIDHASQIDPSVRIGTALAIDGEHCGPDGLAIAAHGDVLVWCSFSRRIERIAHAGLARTPLLARSAGEQLGPSALTTAQHDGMVVFHTADAGVSTAAAVACASCHVEGRADGLSWQIEGRTLQTPMLAGRLVGTAPFKWDGAAKDLRTSVQATVTRLGGSGLTPAHTDELVAYLEELPAVRTPSRPADAIARGKELFESAELGCASCHDGAKYTDQSKHRLAGTLRDVDTPSLIGLAASGPYFHDGSAPTIEVLLRDRGGVHGMADPATKLDDGQVRDLTAFLETL